LNAEAQKQLPAKDCVLMMTPVILAVVVKSGAAMTALMLLQTSASGGGMGMFLPMLLILPIFYFLMIVPNQRKQKKWQQMLNAVKAGDKVTTTGGLRGTVFSVRDDVIQLRLPPDNLKVEVVKAAIASVTTEEEK
jgi:preprotein translocase subunit YajC